MKINANRSFVIYIALASGATAVLWPILVVNFSPLSDFAQITFIVIWLLISIIFALGYQARTRYGYRKLMGITALWLGALSPIYMVASETIVTRMSPSAEQIQPTPSNSSTVTLPPNFPVPSIPELREISDYLTSTIQASSEVAFNSDSLGIVTLLSDTKPYISSRHYSEGLGPAGSDAEYERRLQLLRSWETNPKPNVTNQLCAEGVSVVITNSSSQNSNFDQFNPVSINDWLVVQLPCSIP
jgi:hypothetical protein